MPDYYYFYFLEIKFFECANNAEATIIPHMLMYAERSFLSQLDKKII
jgi:hypothetical protein